MFLCDLQELLLILGAKALADYLSSLVSDPNNMTAYKKLV